MRYALSLLAVLLLAATACGQVAEKATEKAVEQATGVQVNQKGDSVTIKGQNGETVSIGSQIPDELKSFPVPQGFKADASSGGSLTQGKDKTSVASWRGKGSVQSASDFFKKSMVDQGWKQESAMDMDDAAQLSYTKGTNRAIVTINKEDEEVTVNVMLSNAGSGS